MIKRSIGIDIDSNEIRAVQIARQGRRFRLEKVFQAQLPPKTDSPSLLLQSLVRKQGFHHRATAVVSLSHQSIFFHIPNPADPGSNDALSLKNINPKDCFPLAAARVIMDQSPPPVLPDKNNSLITAVLEKSLDQEVALLKNAHLPCEFAQAPLYALNTAVNFHHPQFTRDYGIIIYAGNTHTLVAVTHNKNIIGARNIPHPSTMAKPSPYTPPLEAALLLRETELTWRSLFNQKIPEKIPVVLTGHYSHQPEIPKLLEEKLLCQIIIYDSSQGMNYVNPPELTPNLCIAEGLALHALAPQLTPGPNFIKTRKQNNAPTFNLKKHLYLSIFILTLIGLMWLGGLTARKITLEYKYSKMKNDINSMCRTVLPNQPNLVDELALAQLDSHLQSTKLNYALLASYTNRNPTPLEWLRLIWAHTPNQIQVQIDNLWIDTDNHSIHLEAHCNSFSVPDQWRTILIKAPQFHNVEINNRQKQSDQTVNFAMDISLAHGY